MKANVFARAARRGGARVLCAALALAAMPAALAAQSAAGAAAPARTVTLAELLDHAERRLLPRAPATRRLAQADAARAEAEPLLREQPQLALAAGPRLSTGADPGLDFAASLEQTVELAGARGARLEAASALRARLQAEQTGARAELRRELSLAYRLAAIAHERAALLARASASADQLLAVAQRRLAAGDLGIIEVRVAEAGAAQARAAQLAAELELREARLWLSELSGWPLSDPPLPVPGLPPVPAPPALERVLVAAAADSPELRGLRFAVAEAKARAEVVAREAYPAPTFGVHYGHESEASGPDNHIVLGSVSLPLPFWARAPGARAHALAEAAVAQAEAEAAAAARGGAVLRAHAALVAAAARVSLFDAGVAPQLAESDALLQRAFDAGEISGLELIAARERLFAAQHAALDAHADHARARAALEAALGFELAALDAQPGGAP